MQRRTLKISLSCSSVSINDVFPRWPLILTLLGLYFLWIRINGFISLCYLKTRNEYTFWSAALFRSHAFIILQSYNNVVWFWFEDDFYQAIHIVSRTRAAMVAFRKAFWWIEIVKNMILVLFVTLRDLMSSVRYFKSKAKVSISWPGLIFWYRKILYSQPCDTTYTAGRASPVNADIWLSKRLHRPRHKENRRFC